MAERFPKILRVRGDSTLRWACRRGDFLLWLTPKSLIHLMSGSDDAWQMPDYWEMRDGDSVTITNRSTDLPSWFELHPTELAGGEALRASARLAHGWTPGDILVGPNIWRVKTGDRLAWVGESRLGSEGVEGTLAILDIQESVVVLGESSADPAEGRHVAPGPLRDRMTPAELALAEAMAFGSPSSSAQSPDVTRRCHQAVMFMQSLGIPSFFAPEWTFGGGEDNIVRDCARDDDR
jgi:hypothetical protein